MEGIVDDLLRQGDSEARSKLPQIPLKLIPNLHLNPISKSTVQMTVQEEAPQKGASTIFHFFSYGLN